MLGTVKPNPPIYLHIGFNKTATTTLQEHVFARHPAIAYLGRPYKMPEFAGAGGIAKKGLERAVRAIRMQDTLSYNLHSAHEEISLILDGAKGSGKPIVLSDEGFTSPQWNDRQLIARRLRDAFGPCHILATVRNQLTCIPSLYFSLAAKGVIKNIGFDRWLEKQVARQAGADDAWTIRQFKYAEVFELYRNVFPDATICFIPYELLVEDKASFASAIAQWLGVDEQVTIDTLLAAKAKNVIGSVQAMHVIHGYERLAKIYSRLNKKWIPAFGLKKDLPAVWRVKEALRHGILRSTAARYRGKFVLSEQSKEFITRYYSADNADLCHLVGQDLSKYGYPVSATISRGSSRHYGDAF